MTDWLALLAQAVGAHPRGIAGAAAQLGVSRTAISLVLAGKYPARTDKIAAKVLDTFACVDCPHLGRAITQAECLAYARRPAPTNSPREMRHWRTCRGGCPHFKP